MPMFMDVHRIGSKVKAEDVAAAHQKDLRVQDRHNVRYERYWVDEAAGLIYCLVEAPSAEAAVAVHREAHGLLPDEVHPVVEGR
jgi:hypothetical protein